MTHHFGCAPPQNAAPAPLPVPQFPAYNIAMSSRLPTCERRPNPPMIGFGSRPHVFRWKPTRS